MDPLTTIKRDVEDRDLDWQWDEDHIVDSLEKEADNNFTEDDVIEDVAGELSNLEATIKK